MKVQARHTGASIFELISGNHTAITDQTPEFGGTGLGPMPSEYLLWAIAACFGQSILFVAAKMRKNIEGLTLEVKAEKSLKEHNFGAVTITLGCIGSTDQLEKIAQMAKRYCFVTNSLSMPIQCIIEKNTMP